MNKMYPCVMWMAIWGCTETPSVPPPVTNGTETPEPMTPTEPTGDVFLPAAFQLRQLNVYINDQGEVDRGMFQVRVFDDAEQVCVFEFDASGGVFTYTGDMEETAWAITIPGGAPLLTDSCGDIPRPPLWQGLTLAERVGQFAWGFRAYPASAQALADFETTFGPETWEHIGDAIQSADMFLSAVEGNPENPSGYTEGGFVISEQLDEEGNVAVDNAGDTLLIPVDQLVVDERLVASSLFVQTGTRVLQPEILLAAP